jgi:hypothetical protein
MKMLRHETVAVLRVTKLLHDLEAQAERDGHAYMIELLARLHDELGQMLSMAEARFGGLPPAVQPLSGGGEKQRPPSDGDQQP